MGLSPRVRNYPWDAWLVIPLCMVLWYLVTPAPTLSPASLPPFPHPSSRLPFSAPENPLGCGHTHPLTPLSEEPAPCTGPHITVLNVIRSELHVAFLVVNQVPNVAHTLYISGPLPHSTGHRALQHSKQVSGWATSGLGALLLVTYSLNRGLGRYPVLLGPLPAMLPQENPSPDHFTNPFAKTFFDILPILSI